MSRYCPVCHRVIVAAVHDCRRSTTLLASRHVGRLTAAAMVVEAVDVATRRVSGMLLPYGEVGYTSLGPVLVPGPGLVDIPADVSRVKLVDEHQNPPRSVGWASVIRDTPEGIRGEFILAPTPDGDRVLAEMTPDPTLGGRARDGFSVELVHLELQDTGDEAPVLVAGALSLVAAVTAPAFESAREDGLAASHHMEGNTPMTDEQRERLAALRAQDVLTQAEAAELRDLEAMEAGDGDTGDGDGDQDQGQGQGQGQDQGLQAGQSRPAPRTRRAATVPNVPGPRRRQARPLRDLYAAQARVLSGVSRPEMEAALADITSTANIWTAQDEYAGQLWGGVEYQRRYVPLMLPGTLTSYKGSGWKWTTKPEVGDYAGDKAAVPSNVPVTVATSWQAARLAGAHDIDRKFFDFGDTEFIEAYYAAMREDYAIKSDAKARAFILANAVAAGAAGGTIWHAAAKSAQAVFDATGGQTPDYLLVNSADTFGLLDTPANQQPDPRVLEMFGVTMDKFMPTPGVAAGTVVAGIKGATKFRELGSSPIRVEAINIANGGVDGGVFGYYATEETFEGGIQSATFLAA